MLNGSNVRLRPDWYVLIWSFNLISILIFPFSNSIAFEEPLGEGWHEAQFISWEGGGTLSKVYTEEWDKGHGSFAGRSVCFEEHTENHIETKTWNYYIGEDNRPAYKWRTAVGGTRYYTDCITGQTNIFNLDRDWYGTSYDHMEVRLVDFHDRTHHWGSYHRGSWSWQERENVTDYDYSGKVDVNLIYYIPSLGSGMEIESVILAFSRWWGSGANIKWISVAGKTGRITNNYFNKTLWVFDLTDTGKIIPGKETEPLKIEISGYEWIDDTGKENSFDNYWVEWDRHGYDLEFNSDIPKLYVKVREEKDKKGRDPEVGQADDVNVINGNMYSVIQDLFLPGKGVPIEFIRTYNSRSIYHGPLGYGWTHSYNIVLGENSDGSITERDGDGTLIDFVYEDGWKDAVLDKVEVSGGKVNLAETLEGADLPQSSNIEAFWKFEESSGAIGDETSNNNNGTYNGNLYRQGGKVGYALGFDGNDYVVIPGFGNVAPTDEVTISAWVKVGAIKNQDLFSFYPLVDQNRITVHMPWEDFIHWQFGKPLNGVTTVFPEEVVGKWQHFAFVASASGNFYKIYRNGVEEAVKTGMNSFERYSGDWYIGGRPGSNFTGTIDEVIVWDKALSGSEISSLQDPSVYELRYYSSGTMRIKFDGGITQRWKSYAIVGEEANGTNIKVRFRTSDTEAGLDSATWSQYYDSTAGIITDISDGQWIEIELTLESDITQTYTPILKRLIVNYSGGSKIWETGYKAWNHSVIIKNPDGTFTLTRKYGTQYNFDSSGKLISIVDRNNNKIILSYTDGLLSSITDASGRVITLSYTDGKIAQIADPANRLITYTYDRNNNLIEVRDPAGNVTAYTYDENHNLITITYANGSHRYFAYDGEDRCIETKRDEGNQKFTFSYDPDNSTTIMTDANGNQTTFVYDKDKGVVTSITDALGNVTTSTWDEDINKTSITVP